MMKHIVARIIIISGVVLSLCVEPGLALYCSIETASLRPSAFAQSKFQNSARQSGVEERKKTAVRIAKIIEKCAEAINASIAEYINSLPPVLASSGQKCRVPPYTWQEVAALFREIGNIKVNIPEIGNLRNELSKPKLGLDALCLSLMPLLLESGMYLEILPYTTTHNGWRIEGIPKVAVYEVTQPNMEAIDIMGVNVNLAVIYAGKHVVFDYLRLPAAIRASASLRIQGAPLMVLSPAEADKELGYFYRVRAHIAKTGTLPDDLRTGAAPIDNAFITLFTRQWPDEEFRPFINNPEGFREQCHPSYMENAKKHEACHFAVPRETGERFPYLYELAYSDYRWLRLFQVLETIVFQQGPPMHQEMSKELLGNIMPRILRQIKPGSLPNINEYVHCNAALMTPTIDPSAIFIVITYLPQDFFVKECTAVFERLRSRLNSKFQEPQALLAAI